ncbi:MAG TPA: type VI secretion system tip protein TssI/VgrG [Polyangia bacterium]|nr:type VI secretion system tip protein TssI/VgrG [Polyangia bacterium]
MDPALLAERNIHITTSVPAVPLVFEAMSGQEMLGRPFTYQVDLLSDSEQIDLQAMLGQRMTVHVNGQQGERCFNGVVTEFRAAGGTHHFFRYRATLQPEIALLAYRADSRIFQALSLKDIVLRVLKAGNVTLDGTKLAGTYAPQEYVVQYRESDLNFVSRLMEQAGIFYTFVHEPGKHTMVLLDDTHQCQPAPGYETVSYFVSTGGENTNDEHLFSWSQGARIVPGQFTVRGYRYDTGARTPSGLAKTDLQNADGSARAGADAEVYDYPVMPLTDDEARAEALRRLQEHETWLASTQAEGDTRGLGVGNLVKVQGLRRTGLDKITFLVARAGYLLTVQPYENDAPSGGQQEFHASYTLIDSERGYRTPSDTPKPRVAGPQTATVVGHKNQPADDEICTDEQDRVLVKFNWDRRGEPNGPPDDDADKNKDQSCFVRVSQLWAGSGWGAMYLPRIGHEVIVEFLEGDPDRPIITGRVYNATNPPPYPQKPTQSGIKSRSTKGAGPNNFNELRFDDKKGQEEVFIQAEKNHTTNVKNNRAATVGASDSVSVGGDRSVHVTGNLSVTVDGGGKSPVHSSQKVTGKYTLDATDTIEVQAPTHIKLTCGDSYILMEPGKITLYAGGKAMIVLDQHVAATSSDNSVVVLDANAFMASNKGGSVLLDANVKAQSKDNASVVLDANATITSTSADVKVGGTNVVLNGSTSVSATGGGSAVKLEAAGATMSGTKATISGSSMTEITGGMVKIN